MPGPIPVELSPHDPNWAELARAEATRLIDAVGEVIIRLHHIGSTAIPNIRAKPILDLMPEVRSLTELDRCRGIIEELGFSWWAEFGIAGRRYCTLDDAASGKRKVQLHCFEQNSPEVLRHIAFRDYLRSNPEIARVYEAEKERCRTFHPSNSHDYTDCKDAWIRRVEKDALAAQARGGSFQPQT